MGLPRKQAQRLCDWLTRERPHLRAALLGGRREGKSDLLAQTRHLLFDSAAGPLPFLFRFEPTSDAAGANRAAALFVSSFCQQMRAFLLRQEEILSAPPAGLAEEIQRPGLPLSLSELAREVLGASEKSDEGPGVVELAARLPGRFAHQEGRPVCLFWDDCHHLEAHSPYLNETQGRNTVVAESICFLLTGIAPHMRDLAGRNSWTVLPLNPLSVAEALMLAESLCKESGIRFNRGIWEAWFAVSNTSPGWLTPIIESAAIRGEPLETIEQIGRLYAGEVENGSIGAWLANRWPEVAAPSKSKDIVVGLLKDDVAEHRSDSLERDEWLRRYPVTTEASISPVEADWLRLEADRAVMGSARARARLMQNFLLRARRLQHSREAVGLSSDAIEEHLIFPASEHARLTTPSGDEVQLPKIYSVVRETAPDGELFWAFGETALPKRGKRLDSEGVASGIAPIVLLIALSEKNPTKAVVSEWARRLQQATAASDGSSEASLAELWVVVANGGSLAPAGSEKRLTRSMLEELLTQVTEESESTLPADSEAGAAQSKIGEIGTELARLQERAKSLQRAFRAQPETPFRSAPLSTPAPAPEKPDATSSAEARRNEVLRQALSLSLMLASADLLATGSGTKRASAVELAELQLKCQQLLDELRSETEKT